MRMRMYKVYCTLQPHCRQASGARGPQHKRTHAPHADRGDEHRARGDEARHLRRAGDPSFEPRQPARKDRPAWLGLGLGLADLILTPILNPTP